MWCLIAATMTNSMSTLREDVTLQEVVDDLTWQHLNVNAPGLFINPAFMSALGPKPHYDELCTKVPLSFAPGLSEVLASSSPPSSIDLFLSLPNPQRSNKLWTVYAVVLVKPGCRPKVYNGSGTDAKDGCSGRLNFYNNPRSTRLPKFVKRAYADGFKLAHSGLLCWAPIPAASLVPRARARFIAIEALCTTIFFAAFETVCDTARVPLDWDRDDVQYDPLGSHSPLMEKFAGDLDLTPEQLASNAAARQERRKMLMALASKARDDRERAQDLEGHRTRKRNEKRTWSSNNKAKAYGNERSSITRTKAAKKHYCSVCDISFGKPGLLKNHLLTDSHRSKAANVAKNGHYQPSKNTLRSAKSVAAVKASKKFFCAICDKSFGTPAHLKKHNDSKQHHAKEALFASAAAKPSL